MSTRLVKVTSTTVISIFVIYVISFFILTDKYLILLTDNTCGVARIASSNWEKQLFSVAHVVEKFLIDQETNGTTMHLEINKAELADYFSSQLCNESNGKKVGA